MILLEKMNWLRNKPVIQEKKMEPGATFSAFEQHWAQAVQVMGSSEVSRMVLAGALLYRR